MFTVSNNMIYAKNSRVRQDSLYESNKVDSDNLACLTPKKFSNQQEAKNITTIAIFTTKSRVTQVTVLRNQIRAIHIIFFQDSLYSLRLVILIKLAFFLVFNLF